MSALFAERVEAFEVSVPASTPTLTPQTSLLTIRAGYVVGVELRFPPGGKGLTGIALRQAGQQMIPATAGGFIVGDNETVPIMLDRFALTSQWSALGYNTDTVAHSIYVRLYLNEIVHRPRVDPRPFLPLEL